MQKYLLPLLIAIAPIPGPAAVAKAPADAPPRWFLQHIEFLAQGRWITDHSRYRSEHEPYDPYGMEYEKGIGGKSVRGRLFGLIDGKEAGTFWGFMTAWHPMKNRVIAYQLGGDGAFAEGPMIATGEHGHRTEQVFCSPGGGQRKAGRESEEAPDGSFAAHSFDISGDGSWTRRRSYTWRLEK